MSDRRWVLAAALAAAALSVPAATASSGMLIGIYPNPSGCTNACYALIPINPLRYSTTYTAHVRGRVDNADFDKIWSFTTTDCTYRLDDGTCIG